MKDMWVVMYRPAGSINWERHEFFEKDIAYSTLKQWIYNWSGEGNVTREVLNAR